MFIRDLDDTDNLRAKEAVMLGLPHKSIFAEKVKVGDREIDGNQLKWSWPIVNKVDRKKREKLEKKELCLVWRKTVIVGMGSDGIVKAVNILKKAVV